MLTSLKRWRSATTSARKSLVCSFCPRKYVTLAYIVLGSGYRKNIISHFQIHLGFKGKRSPFHDTAKRITEAVKQNARSTADAFLKDLNGILAQIVELFEVMIKSREDDDPSELPVKRMLAEILEKRKDEVEGMSTSLEMIKARYEGAVIKEEEE